VSTFIEPEDFIKLSATQATAKFGPFSIKALLEEARGLAKSPWTYALGVPLLGLGAAGLWGAVEGGQPGETLSYRINRALNSLTNRIKADETVAGAFAKNVGSGLGEAVVGLTKDMASKGFETLKDTLQLSPTRKKIFGLLKKEDPIIGQADDKTLLEAFHTMAKVAPTLSADKNAVKSLLRLAATSSGGIDFTTIKSLAEAEKAVTGLGGKR